MCAFSLFNIQSNGHKNDGVIIIMMIISQRFKPNLLRGGFRLFRHDIPLDAIIPQMFRTLFIGFETKLFISLQEKRPQSHQLMRNRVFRSINVGIIAAYFELESV
jgi:hypothetical protein